jgi:hypothetical protein
MLVSPGIMLLMYKFGTLVALVYIRQPLRCRGGAEHGKGPEPRCETPALFPLPQKRYVYYSGVGPGHSEGPEPSWTESSDPMIEAGRAGTSSVSTYTCGRSVVPASPGIVILALPEVSRNAEGAKQGRANGRKTRKVDQRAQGQYKGRSPVQ